MTGHINRRTLLGGGVGAFAAAGAGRLVHAAEALSEGQAVSSPPDAACWATPLAQDYTVAFRSQVAGRGIDGVGIARLPDGMLIATIPVVLEEGWTCLVVQSSDGGQSWGEPVAELPCHTVTPFVHQGQLYLFADPWGRRTRFLDLTLLRSDDAGRTWFDPVTVAKGTFWNCQTGMTILNDRFYWAIDDRSLGAARRGHRVLAADLSRELMDSESWRISNFVPFPGLPDSLLNPKMTGSYPSNPMLEPNVLNVGGRLRIVSTVKPPLQATTNLAAVFDVTDDGQNLELSFTQYHPMPGGQVKFCVIWDEVSQMFWATVNLAVDGQDQFQFKDPAEHRGNRPYSGGLGGNDRRFLMLMYGIDGLNWFPAGCVARAGRLGQSFMYASQVIDGEDLAIIARSSVDGQNRHDADTATFHRVRNFRRLAMNLRQDIDADATIDS